MQGAFLSTGRTEDYIALGDTGQPVHKAALQIIAALTRKSPELAKFLAVPKSNEQGSVIDWYSPVPGEVIPWSSVSETDRADARLKFQSFKAGIADLGNALVASSAKSNQSDTVIFGKLLGLASHSPDDACIKIIKSQRVTPDGVSEPYNQPVLTFWGFILNEEDRKRSPLYFLDPPPAKVAVSAATTPAMPSTPRVATPPEPVPVLEKKRPWWLFWTGWRLGFGWLWPLLLLLLLLLLLSLLRGCIPGISLPHFGAPSNTSPDIGLTAPLLNNQSGAPSGLAADAGMQNTDTTPTMMSEPVQGEANLPLPPNDQAQVATSGPQEPDPTALSSKAPEEQAPQPAVTPSPPGSATDRATTPPTLDIPQGAVEGPASFLNGSYRAGAGIQDRRTGKPLRLEYAFEGGKGKVTVQRPDGIACTGGVIASMNGGNLAIISKGQAACSDGSQYDMPEVNCKPGAESIADCTGKYGNDTFPMSMRKTDK